MTFYQSSLAFRLRVTQILRPVAVPLPVLLWFSFLNARSARHRTAERRGGMVGGDGVDPISFLAAEMQLRKCGE